MADKKSSGIRRIAGFPAELMHNRTLIASLAKNDFKTKFAGSYLGVIWAFVQPIITVLVYWFVFTVGLRAGQPSGHPYILWLMAGLVPWFFFSEAINGGTNALLEYNYLVKKVVFNIDILPPVKVSSALFVHVIFTLFTILLCWCNGYTPDLYMLQILYYMIGTIVLVLSVSYFTSAVVVFFRDLTQIVNIALQMGVWLTPIMWDANDMLREHPTLARIFKLNPVYYIVDGFRDAMLNKVWFWEKPTWTLVFWITVLLCWTLGVTVFERLKVHFADVL